jgi:outer membrane beta-barrel protein
MRRLLAIACLAAATPAVATAQEEDVPGLDLSGAPKSEEPEQKPEDEELPGMDLSKPAEPAPPAAPPAPTSEARPERPFSDKDVALGDKVKAVQRKGFLRRGRIEVSPMFAATANDAYYQKFGGGLRVGYNLQDSFELAVRWTQYSQMRTDNVREGKIAFQSQLLNSELYQQLMVDGIWSPVYGKAALLGRSIVHFDLFLAGGFGLVETASTEAPLRQGFTLYDVDIPVLGRKTFRGHLATEVGGGVRFYPREWMAVEVGLLATFYPDQTVHSLPATMQRVFVANMGVSFFWPFSFEYVYQ